jgi:hypothetical protein
MADPGVTGPALSPAARRILDGWLERLGAALPVGSQLRGRILDELHDGLHSAVEHRLATGTDPVVAAQAVVADFGDPEVVVASFRGELTAHLARRIGIVLIASGPLVGAAWLAALVPPLWPPRPADLLSAHPLYVGVLAIAIPAALLAVAATGPLGRWLPRHPAHAARAAVVAVTACAAGDGLLLTTLVLTALSTPHTLAWSTALLAAAMSVARLGLATRAAHRCLREPAIRVAAEH